MKQAAPVQEIINNPRFPRFPLRDAAALARLLTPLLEP